MSDVSDVRIDDLIMWHRDRATTERLRYFDAPAGARRECHARAAAYHQDTADALTELAKIRAYENAREDEHG